MADNDDGDAIEEREQADSDSDPADPKSQAKSSKPPLEKLREVYSESDTTAKESHEAKREERSSCPDYFGVKSYLHNFYEKGVKDPAIYEDEDDFRYLIHPNPRRRRCTPIWWKVFVWIGANLLVFGVIGIIVGYSIPQQPVILDIDKQGNEIINRNAITYDFNLDICKLVGLIIFCIGGLTLTIALIFPSCLYNYCDEERKLGSESFKVRLLKDDLPSKSPLDMAIPATGNEKFVQPERKKEESIVTPEGIVKMTDEHAIIQK
ncbi:unnamed protein product [Owenia fusiformis]|uniref:Uncharacterized protein n=1 Tax=Owenia fusiformis TaxID=6347 RepID=A0A8J1U8M9_OWEFU|nr:unnamed protein product [Owenia fusiformis]